MSRELSQEEKDLEKAAREYAVNMWGVYFNDKHPDIAITETQGEISIKDFIAGAKSEEAKYYWQEYWERFNND